MVKEIKLQKTKNVPNAAQGLKEALQKLWKLHLFGLMAMGYYKKKYKLQTKLNPGYFI